MAWHARLKPGLATWLVPAFHHRFSVVTEVLTGPAGDFPSYVITPRGIEPRTTVFWMHGGGFVTPIDPFHTKYVARLASALRARVVLPDFPCAPEHTWRDSHEALADDVARWAERSRVVLGGDSAGGGYALALAQTVRDRGGARPDRMLLLAPWADLTTSTPETHELGSVDPWLILGNMLIYAEWWAGSPDDLGRPEVSPALGDLRDLPPALMFCGTRDLLMPGCRLLADRGAAAGWDLTYVERPDLLHVFPLLPVIPEARLAWRHTLEFLR